MNHLAGLHGPRHALHLCVCSFESTVLIISTRRILVVLAAASCIANY